MSNTTAKKARKVPVMSEATRELAELIKAAGLDLEQLRLLEREVTAQKKAKTPKAGESKSAQAKAKSLEKHSSAMREARKALADGREAKAREFLGVLPGVALQALAGEFKVKGRSKIKAKADLVTAIVKAGLAEVRKAA